MILDGTSNLINSYRNNKLNVNKVAKDKIIKIIKFCIFLIIVLIGLSIYTTRFKISY